MPTYQSECIRREVRLLEERDGDFASNNAEVGSISSLEKLIKDSLFLRREIEVRVPLC
jgi:hypothetical protein